MQFNTEGTDGKRRTSPRKEAADAAAASKPTMAIRSPHIFTHNMKHMSPASTILW
jgi:hypothetical protein